ncbi:MAG: hypothetical protein MZV65_17465 [Chromatiales bacterium]|nr:hypothetical protein [Chromatiales bacterium]
MTFLAVVAGWVFFRANDAGTAWSMLASMAGAHGFDPAHAFANELVHRDSALKWIVGVALLAFFAPNTQQLFARHAPSLEPVSDGRPLAWSPTARWAVAANLLALVALYHMNRVSEFLYFQF